MTQRTQKEMVSGMTYLVDAIDTRNVANANTTPQQLNPNHVLIRAGTVKDYARFRIWIGASKTAAADSATTNIYFGPNGDSTDALIGTIATLSGANRSQGIMLLYKRTSNIGLQRQGSGSIGTSYNSVSTFAYPPIVPVADMDVNNMYVSLYNTMTTGAEQFVVEDYFVELIPSDSQS